jgi:hypothetical protein
MLPKHAPVVYSPLTPFSEAASGITGDVTVRFNRSLQQPKQPSAE